MAFGKMPFVGNSEYLIFCSIKNADKLTYPKECSSELLSLIQTLFVI